MNYDNLLAQIDLLAQPNAGSSNNKPSFYKALRAVVELTEINTHAVNSTAFRAGWETAMNMVTHAIEKELK